MKKIIFSFLILFLLAPVVTVAAEDAPAWQVFPIKWELAFFNERIATNNAIDRLVDRVIARLDERAASQRQEGPFTVRKDLEEYNKFLEEKR